MERRAASHTEEEEMNQRRKLLNAARRGETKAITKLFELYQVRVLSGDQLAKVNRSSAYMVPMRPARGKAAAKRPSQKKMKHAPSKPSKIGVKKQKKSPRKAAAKKAKRLNKGRHFKLKPKSKHK